MTVRAVVVTNAWTGSLTPMPRSRALRMAPSTVSHHLGVLLHAGLVARTRAGRSVLYRRTGAGQRLLDTAA
jgi:DNA-binding transcriptional ArsR family regulator